MNSNIFKPHRDPSINQTFHLRKMRLKMVKLVMYRNRTNKWQSQYLNPEGWLLTTIQSTPAHTQSPRRLICPLQLSEIAFDQNHISQAIPA